VQSFLFATDIENSSPRVMRRDGRIARVDQMEATGHCQRYREDLALVKVLGIDVLRYDAPSYRAHAGPGRHDWDFSDAAFGEIWRLGITPCVELCPFGLPDWLENFQNPEFPVHFADYARAFAERFPWVRLYTPINEMYVAAHFSAQLGLWNECLKSDRAFVTATKHIAKANLLATLAIIEVQPAARFIQSESSEYFHPSNPDAVKVARALNERRLLSLDLCYGYDLCAFRLPVRAGRHAGDDCRREGRAPGACRQRAGPLLRRGTAARGRGAERPGHRGLHPRGGRDHLPSCRHLQDGA